MPQHPGTHLVDGSAVPLLHLVELIDAAHALVRQHQRAALQHQLLGHLPGREREQQEEQPH